MEYLTKNFFNVENPDEFICEIQSYLKSHRHLVIVAYRLDTGERHYFDFPAAYYFEGPTFWRGANFCVATKEAFSELLQKLDLDVDTRLNPNRFFVVETEGLLVKIIAGNGLKIKTPDVISYLEDS